MGMDDRNRRCRVLCGYGCRGWWSGDEISLELNHLPGNLRESLRSTLRISALDNDVLAFHITEFAQTLEQCVVHFLVSVRDKPDEPLLARLLRPRRERPRGRRA